MPLYPVILSIPLRETGDTVLDRSRRPEADVALEIGDVGISRFDVTQLHWQQFPHGRPAKLLFQYCDHVCQLFRTIVADIVNFPGRGAAGWIRPARIPIGPSRRRTIDEANHGLADVVGEGKIAPHLAMVEELDRRTCEDG